MKIGKQPLTQFVASQKTATPPASVQTKAPAEDTFTFSSSNSRKLKEVIGFTALGAAGGAIGGHFGGGPFSTTLATAAASASVDFAGTYVEESFHRSSTREIALALAPVAGATLGTVSGLAGYALSATTGMSPVLAGAISGGLTHGIMAAIG